METIFICDSNIQNYQECEKYILAQKNNDDSILYTLVKYTNRPHILLMRESNIENVLQNFHQNFQREEKEVKEVKETTINWKKSVCIFLMQHILFSKNIHCDLKSTKKCIVFATKNETSELPFDKLIEACKNSGWTFEFHIS